MSAQSGFSIVEIIIAAAVFVAAVSIFIVSFDFLDGLADQTQEATQVALLLEEGAEAMLLLRDLGWDDRIAGLATDRSYSLHWDGAGYRLSETPVVINGYRRSVTLYPVYRNPSGGYANSGTVDPRTRRAVIEIFPDNVNEPAVAAQMLIHDSHD